MIWMTKSDCFKKQMINRLLQVIQMKKSSRMKRQTFVVTVNGKPYRKVRSKKQYAMILKDLRKKNIKVRLV